MRRRGAPRRFVVLSTQRSGSNWLEDRLDSHPAITMWRSEPFRETGDFEGSYRRFASRSFARRLGATLVPSVSKAVFVAGLTRVSSEAVGFRLMYDQLRRSPSLGISLPLLGHSVVHLVRENVLATYLSTLAAKDSGVFVSRGHRETPPVVVPTESLVEELGRRQALIDRHRRLVRHLESLEVRYEEYVKDPEGHDGRLLAFLGLPSHPLVSRFRRLGEPSLIARIKNADEVSECLRDTGYFALLTGSEASS